MPKQLIPHSLRTALWRAYDYRCFYCTELVGYDLLEIDHVVPESYQDNPTKNELLTSYGLAADWDLRGTANLVPSCRRCNGRKSAMLANPNQMVVFLTQAGKKLAKVESLYESILAKIKRDNLGAQLAIGIQTGTLTSGQVEQILRNSDQGFLGIALSPLESSFIDVPLSDVKPDNVEHLYDKTVRLGGNNFTGLEMTHPTNDRETETVQTIRQYRAFIQRGWYCRTTFDMKMQGFFQLAEGILRALSASRPHMSSFIEDPHVGVTDLTMMPSSILPYMGDNDGKHQALVAANPTFAEMAVAGELELTWCSSAFLEVKYQGFFASFREVLRSDLDGDGIEDLLIFIYVRADGGTMAFGMDPMALARKSMGGMFETTEIAPSPANKAN